MEDDRSELVQRTLAKGVALLVVIAVVIAIGTFVFVKALGLDSSGTDSGAVYGEGPVNALPSTALPNPHESSSTDDEGDDSDETGIGQSGSVNEKVSKKLRLSISPLNVSPMERINVTGTYGHKDDIALQVQRFENGVWADFPTQANVSLGTFATYIKTSHTGPNKFRVYDPDAKVASNVVTVTVR